MNRKVIAALSFVVIASFISRDAGAQSLASRVASVGSGKVRFSFAARPEVCGWGNGISRGGNSRMNWTSDSSPDVIYDEECSHSPVRIVLYVDRGRPTKLRTYVGGRWRAPTSETTDLGTISTREATGYLLSLASSEASRVGQEAIMPATLADSVNIWPQLLRIARDDNAPRGSHQQAMFWLGQAAADVVSPDHDGRARETEDVEVKKQAVFAISQRRNGEAVPALIEVARRNRDPEVRRTALFWLGQSGDARAISLFEEILK